MPVLVLLIVLVVVLSLVLESAVETMKNRVFQINAGRVAIRIIRQRR
jgi:hypothetical protein